MFVDRAIGLLSTLTIAGFFYLLFLRGKGAAITSSDQSSFLDSAVDYKRVLLWTLGVIAVIFCGLLLHRRGRVAMKKAWSYICVRSVKIIDKFRNAVILYCSSPLTILAVFGLTVFLQITQITGFWLLGQNMGIDVSIKYYYVFFTLTWVFGAVPVSIGGAVVVEGSLAYLFIRLAGVKPELALALALCQRVVWMLASLPGAMIHLIGAHLPKDFFIDYDESVN